jgi:two-component system OmpR family response regulator/two-component system response regulator TctD
MNGTIGQTNLLATDFSRAFPHLPDRDSIREAADGRPAVLLVDDDPDIPPLVVAALSPFQITVDMAATGAEALIKLEQGGYELLVLDLGLADLHGFEILRYIRTHPRLKGIKVLVLTANTSLEALARSFGHGADDFVKKPFDLREFGMRAFRLLRPYGG